MKKTKAITFEQELAELFPLKEKPCCTNEICNCVKPITLKSSKRPAEREQVDWTEDNYEEDK